MTDSIAPRSDQVNADDLMTGPRTFTIAEVRAGNEEQPVNIYLAEFPKGRPWKPSKSMRRILVAAWGKDAEQYVGKRLTLFRDPSIRFGKDEVGGIRISHMSDLDRPLKVALTVTRGKRAPYTVEPLPSDAPAAAPVDEETVARIATLRAEWSTATPERQAEIQAEVARLNTPAEQAAGEESARGVEG